MSRKKRFNGKMAIFGVFRISTNNVIAKGSVKMHGPNSKSCWTLGNIDALENASQMGEVGTLKTELLDPG